MVVEFKDGTVGPTTCGITPVARAAVAEIRDVIGRNANHPCAALDAAGWVPSDRGGATLDLVADITHAKQADDMAEKL